MTIRIRDRARPGLILDRDLGPHAGIVERLPVKLMRLDLDAAIVYSASHARPIRVR